MVEKTLLPRYPGIHIILVVASPGVGLGTEDSVLVGVVTEM